MNSVRLPRLARDFDLRIVAHTAHTAHTGASVCHVCHSALVTHMAHTHTGRVLAGRVLTHTTHGQPALVLPALVLRGQRPAASAKAGVAGPSG